MPLIFVHLLSMFLCLLCYTAAGNRLMYRGFWLAAGAVFLLLVFCHLLLNKPHELEVVEAKWQTLPNVKKITLEYTDGSSTTKAIGYPSTTKVFFVSEETAQL